MTTFSLLSQRAVGFAIAASLIAIAGACNESVTAPVLAAPSGVVASIVTNVYIPTFDSLAVRGARLSDALDALEADPTPTTLATAQAAWRAVRVYYERNEGFAFGPLITNEIDPSIDTWPVDVTGIDALVASSASPSTPGEIEGLDGTLKGFHGIEYILFGIGNSTTAASLTPNKLTYLSVVGQNVKQKTQALADAWNANGGDYAGQLISAGSGTSVYVSVGAAVAEIVGGIVGPTDEVANSKIAVPLSSGDTQYEESAFSDNTLADLQNDLTGAYAAYTGAYGGDGNGISAFVASQSPALDTQVRNQFAAAFAALDAVGPSFDQTLHNNPALLHTAQQAILTLNHTLVNSVAPLVGQIADDAD